MYFFRIVVSVDTLFLPTFCSAQNEAELVNKVRAKLDKVNDYKAEGTMNIDVPFIKAAPSGVTVFYKKPSKFRVTKEGGISILPKGGMNVNLGSILAMEKYTVVPAGESVMAGGKVKTVKLLPEDENSSVVITTLYIDEANSVDTEVSRNDERKRNL